MMTESTLPKWRPGTGATVIDSARNYGGQEPDGFAIYSKNRDSGLLEQSNYDGILADLRAKAKELGAEDKVWIHTFSHWGFGYGETIILDGDAPQELIDYAEGIDNALADYPVYDDSDFSQREHDACREYWEGADAQERMRIAKRARAKMPLRFACMSFRALCDDFEDVYSYLRDIATE